RSSAVISPSGYQRCSIRLCDVAARALDPDKRASARAHNRLDRATARLGLGQLDGAISDGMEALDSLRLTSAIVTRAGDLDRVLARGYGDVAAVRDFHERYVTVRREVERRAVTAT
ncbi:MAG: hypothetical protein L0Y54_10130, partial [Sporichthyaceae bacterium]|nr:hypothetical protein [Sporichthyaceae bacterium]